MIGAPIQINVAAPPRGGGSQAARQIQAQSMHGSFAWGSAPGQATLVYPGTTVPVTAGARMDFTIGAHYFAGICESDTLVQSSNGTLRTLQFKDMRYFLSWDWVFGAWNMPDVRLVNGVRVKRYWHIFPADWSYQRKTYTTSPLLAWQILEMAFQAPTVWTEWEWDLTGNGLFPDGLLNGAIYEIDAGNGLRLDALLNLIGDKTGLVFTHDPRPVAGTVVGPNLGLADCRLVFTRKGYGLLPLPFPSNSNDRRQGISLTENPWNICVLGERNKYQYLNVPMVKDWAAAWEQFLDVELFVKDIFDNETDPISGQPYNAFANDPDQWFGYGAARARALEITVSQYITLRGARAGNGDAATFADNRKYAGRWRMDMPAALYLQNLVFRAFKPNLGYLDADSLSATYGQIIPAILNVRGNAVPLDSAPIADELLCRVYLDYATGNMTADPTQPVDGNGLLAVLGYQVGEDLFRFAQPDRVNTNFFSASSRGWSSVNFQIDDSGEGTRFIIAEAPVFVSDNLLASVNGYNVLNAGFTLETPQAAAALVFEAERFVYWKGTGLVSTLGELDPTQPLPGRNRVEPVNGLQQEFLVDANSGIEFTEIPYADGLSADTKASQVATSLLLLQSNYLVGGYNLKWNPKLDISQFGTPLAPGNSSQIDRVEIQASDAGVAEVVDFTMERSRDRFEPERELDRRTLQNSLFPGQQALRQESMDQQRLNAGLRQMGNLLSLFQKLLRGEVSDGLQYLRFIPGGSLPATLPVGTPLVINPQPAGSSGNATAVAPASVAASTTNKFAGVTVRHNEPTDRTFCVRTIGDAYAQVMGPVAVNDAIGLSSAGGTDFGTNGAYLVKGGTPPAGLAMEAISGTGVQLIKVRLGSGGSTTTAGFNYRGLYNPATIYMTEEVVLLGAGTSAGIYISTIDNNSNLPDSGTGWTQISSFATWL